MQGISGENSVGLGILSHSKLFMAYLGGLKENQGKSRKCKAIYKLW